MRTLVLTLSSLLAILLVGFGVASKAEAQTFAVTSPSSNALIYRGSTFNVTYTSDPTVTNIAVVCGFTNCFSSTVAGTKTISVTVPATTTPDSYQLVVVGTSGGQVVSSAPITIRIDTPLSILSTTTNPVNLYFNGVGQTLPLVVLGTLSDASTEVVTHSARISYSSTNTAVATVDTLGNVTAVGVGTAYITITGASQPYLVFTSVAAASAGTPTFTPPPATFTAPQTVAVSSATSGASIYYTTDGSLPTAHSTLYTAPVSVAATESINAIAIAQNYQNSFVATGLFTILIPAAAPTFSPGPGTFTSAQSVTIADASPGASIYYTTDGSTPTVASTVYSAPIAIGVTTKLQAIASGAAYSPSTVTSGTYTILPPAVAPVFSPAPGTYTSAQTVAIADASPGASIYYTTDGSTPSVASTLYSAPIAIGVTTKLQAIASGTGYSPSAVTSGTYTITPDFSFALSPSSLSISKGKSGTVTATVTPLFGFNQTVTFTCSGAPSDATCTFSPTTVTPGGAPATTVVTIQSTATGSLILKPFSFTLGSQGIALAALLCFGLRRRFHLTRAVKATLGILALGLALTLSGCASKSSTPSGPENATVTLTATSGTTTHSTTFSLTVN